jgi:IS30 family transposase
VRFLRPVVAVVVGRVAPQFPGDRTAVPPERSAHFRVADMARVGRLLRKKWSAEQVSGTLTKQGLLRISHETIYRRIRWDKKAGGDLWRHTRIMSKFGRKRYRSHDSRGVLPGKRPIGDRPVEIEGRQCLGRWEGDTVTAATCGIACSRWWSARLGTRSSRNCARATRTG